MTEIALAIAFTAFAAMMLYSLHSIIKNAGIHTVYVVENPANGCVGITKLTSTSPISFDEVCDYYETDRDYDLRFGDDAIYFVNTDEIEVINLDKGK